MVRTYIRKTDRGKVNSAHIYSAVKKVLIEKKALCHVGIEMSIPRRSLTRYCSNAKQIDADLSAVVENPKFSSSIGGYKLKTVTIAEHIAMSLLVYF
jgi:hypothetical protein